MRRLVLVALLAASCSYDSEVASIFIHVDGIPAAADHLDVVVTPSDTSVVGKNCTSSVSAANATCYRPTFQPAEVAVPEGRSVDMAFAAPAPTGTFTMSVVAADRTCPSVCTTGLAFGTANGSLPGPVQLQVTLH
ncbi:MAG: hypothetical protein ABR567_17115 [Myxococcales bacterium]|nr:hypothetical protein [Myxococcales bacterium]